MKRTVKPAEKFDSSSFPIVFNTEVRRTLVEGILQDLKGYFESKTDGLVEITYEDYKLKNHEFGFKMHMLKTPSCKKQMFSEVASAVINAVNYAFPGENDQYDVLISTEDSKVDFEVVSLW